MKTLAVFIFAFIFSGCMLTTPPKGMNISDQEKDLKECKQIGLDAYNEFMKDTRKYMRQVRRELKSIGKTAKDKAYFKCLEDRGWEVDLHPSAYDGFACEISSSQAYKDETEGSAGLPRDERDKMYFRAKDEYKRRYIQCMRSKGYEMQWW